MVGLQVESWKGGGGGRVDRTGAARPPVLDMMDVDKQTAVAVAKQGVVHKTRQTLSFFFLLLPFVFRPSFFFKSKIGFGLHLFSGFLYAAEIHSGKLTSIANHYRFRSGQTINYSLLILM